MADAAELQKIQQTLDYFNRYYEFDSSIKTLKENRLQLEKYIQTKHTVESKFDVDGKTKKSLMIAAAAAVVGALIVLLVTGFSFSIVSIIVAVAVAAVLGGGVFIGFKMYLKKQVDQKWAEQQKANEDLQRQIEDIDDRCRRLDDQKQGYLGGLEEKGLVVIPTKYLIEAEKIASYVREDKCATAEEAVKMFEEEQVRLKEKAIADRKKRDEEAKQRAAKLEQQRRERQKELEMQRALEEQMRESALEKERTAAVEEAEKPKQSGLSMSGGAKKTQEAKETPKAPEPEHIPAPEPVKAQPVAPTPAQPEEEKPHGGLSLAGKKGEHTPQRMAQPVRTQQQPTEEAKPQEERAQRFSGLSLSGRSDAKKKHPAPTPKPKNEPIHLVDDIDDNIVDEETADLENMMKDLLSPSHNSSPLFRNPIHKDVAPTRDVSGVNNVSQEDDFDELAFLDEPKAAEAPEVPTVPEEPTVPEVPAEEPPAAPTAPTEPEEPEVPVVTEVLVAPEEPAAPEVHTVPTESEVPEEPPKSIGWAMAKKKK